MQEKRGGLESAPPWHLRCLAERACMLYDVAVAGLGGMGSAILAHCAGRGASVIGLEQFPRGHALGSSSGKSRMIRQAYFEDPAYVPLVLRAYDLWAELEQTSGQELLRITGVLTVGEETSEIVRGTLRAAQEHDLAVEALSNSEVHQRYPMLKLLPDEVAVIEGSAGMLTPEKAINTQLQIAEGKGAHTRFEVGLRSWRPTSEGVEVFLSDGTKVKARKLVLTLGPWFQEILRELGITIRVQRNVQAWFTSASHAYDAPGFPSFLLNRRGLPAPLYGFPNCGDGVKAAFHGAGGLTTADGVDREVDHTRDIAPITKAMEEWMPGSTSTLREAKACLYSLTPDEHFIVDHHPEHSNVVLCGGFSGHGFKFAPVIGEIGADLALDGGTRHKIGFLSLRRFRRASL